MESTLLVVKELVLGWLLVLVVVVVVGWLLLVVVVVVRLLVLDDIAGMLGMIANCTVGLARLFWPFVFLWVHCSGSIEWNYTYTYNYTFILTPMHHNPQQTAANSKVARFTFGLVHLLREKRLKADRSELRVNRSVGFVVKRGSAYVQNIPIFVFKQSSACRSSITPKTILIHSRGTKMFLVWNDSRR